MSITSIEAPDYKIRNQLQFGRNSQQYWQNQLPSRDELLDKLPNDVKRGDCVVRAREETKRELISRFFRAIFDKEARRKPVDQFQSRLFEGPYGRKFRVDATEYNIFERPTLYRVYRLGADEFGEPKETLKRFGKDKRKDVDAGTVIDYLVQAAPRRRLDTMFEPDWSDELMTKPTIRINGLRPSSSAPA